MSIRPRVRKVADIWTLWGIRKELWRTDRVEFYRFRVVNPDLVKAHLGLDVRRGQFIRPPAYITVAKKYRLDYERERGKSSLYVEVDYKVSMRAVDVEDLEKFREAVEDIGESLIREQFVEFWAIVDTPESRRRKLLDYLHQPEPPSMYWSYIDETYGECRYRYRLDRPWKEVPFPPTQYLVRE